jgi:hypothetical protein
MSADKDDGTMKTISCDLGQCDMAYEIGKKNFS